MFCQSPRSSWEEPRRANGPSWHEFSDGRSVLTCWGIIDDREPPILVSFDGKTYTASTNASYFFVALGDPPHPEDPAMPRLVSDR